MPCRLYLVNCLAINSSYLIPRFYPLQFANDPYSLYQKHLALDVIHGPMTW